MVSANFVNQQHEMEDTKRALKKAQKVDPIFSISMYSIGFFVLLGHGFCSLIDWLKDDVGSKKFNKEKH